MPIEFRCPACNKLLRTADDKAGASAKCPDCGAAVRVPSAAAEEYDVGDGLSDYDFEDAGEREPDVAPRRSRYGAGGPTGAAPSAPAATIPCPMCGEQIRASSTRCRYCGEDLISESRGGPTRIDAGEVISTSWEIFKSEMGVCIGGFVTLIVLLIVAGVVNRLVQTALFGPLAAAPANLGGHLARMFVAVIVSLLIQSFISAGQHLFFLNVARGTRPEIGHLFSGGPYYIKIFLGTLAIYLLLCIPYISMAYAIFAAQQLIWAATIFVLAAGIFIGLAFWPYQFVTVDKDPAVLEILPRTMRYTSGNWGASLMLFVAAIAFNLLGMIALCIGLLFSVPFTLLMFAVAYCRMTGQRTAL